MLIQKKLYYPLLIALGLALFPFLFISESAINNAIQISWILILSAILLGIYTHHNSIPAFNQTEYIVSLGLSILFFIMLSIDQILSSNLFTTSLSANTHSIGICILVNIWKYAIYLPMLFYGIYLCCLFSTYYCLHFSKKLSALPPKSSTTKQVYLYCLLSIIAISIIYLSSAYPGIFVKDDVAGVWHIAVNHYWDDWHTLGYVLYIWACSQFGNTIFAALVIDTLIWIVLNAYVLYVLKDYSTSSMKLYTILLIVSGTSFVYLGYMVKDVVYTFGILALTAGLFHINYRKHMSVPDFLILASITLFTSLCRHAGLVVVLIALLTCGIYHLIRRNFSLVLKLAGILCIHIACFLLIQTVIFNYLECTPNPSYVKYGTPMAMIGAAASQGVEFEPEDQARLEEVMPIKRWADCYDKYWVDSIARDWGSIGDDIYTVQDLVENNNYGSFLIKMNAWILIKHPVIYCRALFDMNSIIWEISLPSDIESMSIASMPKYNSVYYTAFYPITHGIANFLDNQPLTNALFYRGGFSLFLLIFYTAIFIIRKTPWHLFCMLPALINSLLLSITIPAQDTRYILPILLSMLFMSAVVWAIREPKKEETRYK